MNEATGVVLKPTEASPLEGHAPQRPPMPPNASTLVQSWAFSGRVLGTFIRTQQKSLLPGLVPPIVIHFRSFSRSTRVLVFFFLVVKTFVTCVSQHWENNYDDVNITTHFHLLLSLLLDTKNIDTVNHRTL